MIDLFKETKRLGELMAHRAIENCKNKPTHKRISYEKLNQFCKQILLTYPNEKANLNQHVSLALEEFQEIAEKKIEDNYRPRSVIFDPQTIVNLSQTSIPTDILLLLSFGPKFVLPPSNKLENIINIITETTVCIDRNFPITSSQEAFKQTSLQLKNYCKILKNDTDIWLLFIQYRTQVSERNVFINEK